MTSHHRQVCLNEALANGSVEYWYQPKINLVRRQLVGFETFARIRHAKLGVVPAEAFLAKADSESAARLSEQALVSALKTNQNLREMGIFNIRLAINMQMEALLKLSLAGSVPKSRGTKDSISLIFDVPEREIIASIDKIPAIADQLRRCGFRLAIDDFGRWLRSEMQYGASLDHQLLRAFQTLKQLQGGLFAEMKLDRQLVSGCSVDRRKRSICAKIIELAHNLGCSAVAVGIEQSRDAEMLTKLGCDIGQGYFFGKPMSEDAFIMSLWQRAMRRVSYPDTDKIFQRVLA